MDLVRRDGETVYSVGEYDEALGEFWAPSIPPTSRIATDPSLVSETVFYAQAHTSRGAGDITGDALAELVVGVGTEEANRVMMGLNFSTAGGAPTISADWQNVLTPYRDNALIDINGDGLPDNVELAAQFAEQLYPAPLRTDGELRVRMNSGRGYGASQSAMLPAPHHYEPFWPDEVRRLPPTGGPCPTTYEHCGLAGRDTYAGDLRYRYLDYNQDGLTDFLVLGDHQFVYLSTGRAFVRQTLPFVWDDGLQTYTADNGGAGLLFRRRPPFLVGDVNADGQPDFLYVWART